MNCGLYKIVNKINRKFYIGSSDDIQRRWRDGHLNKLRKNKHDNQHLQNSWNKYGEVNFELIPYNFCDSKLLLSEEQKELDFWVGKDECYNIRKDAICPVAVGEHRSNKVKSKISLAQKGKPRWTEEQKTQMSIKRNGRKHSVTTKLKMKNRPSSFKNIQKAQLFNNGRIYSKEHCLKISINKKLKCKKLSQEELNRIKAGIRKSIQEGRFRKNKIPINEYGNIKRLYLSGMNKRKLAFKYGICPASMAKLLERIGV